MPHDGRSGQAFPTPRWDGPERKTNPLRWYRPLLVSNRLIVAGASEAPLAVSPYTGDMLDRQHLSGAALPASASVAEGVVLIVAADGRLLALR